MVDKKKTDKGISRFLKIIPKNEILAIVIALAFVALVIAAGGSGRVVVISDVLQGNPANGTNWTTTMNFSCSYDVEDALNATLYYNASGGDIEYIAANRLGNSSAFKENTGLWAPTILNISSMYLNSSLYPDSAYYNITCRVCNASLCNYTSQPSFNVTIDSKPPRVTGLIVNFTAASNYGNWSGEIEINVSANDNTSAVGVLPDMLYGRKMNVSSVWGTINHTNGSSVLQVKNSTFQAVKKRGSENEWYIKINISNIWNGTDGFYRFYVMANDTLDNRNNSEYITILIDPFAPPRVTNFTNGATSGSYQNASVELNVSVWGGNVTDVWFNITNRTGGAGGHDVSAGAGQVNYSKATAARSTSNSSYFKYYNLTFNTAGVPDGKYNITAYANRTNYTSGVAIINNTEYSQIHIDNTAPSATYTCTPSAVVIGQIVSCTCSGSDGTYGSGVATTTTTTGTVTATAIGTFSPTCTVVDNKGYSTIVTGTYSVTNPQSEDTGGGGGSKGTTTTSKVTVSPENPAVLSGFETGTGIKEIELSVTETVENAEVKVTKYESNPTSVSIAKASNVYKYIQIEESLGTKLKTATITVSVEKTWVTTNELEKENVAVFKFDDTGKWNELSTTYSSEDANNYYYAVVVTDFSYFAIGAKKEEAVTPPEEEEPLDIAGFFSKIPVWAWIVAGVVVLAAIIGGGMAVGKKKRKR